MKPKEPDYEKEIAEITGAFRKATKDIRGELDSVDVETFTYPKIKPVLGKISGILTGLFTKVSDFVAGLYSKAAADGIQRAMNKLDTTDESKSKRPNAEMVTAMTEDSVSDILAVTQNVDRKTKAAVRRAYADSLRANLSAGINGRRTISRDILAGIHKTLADSTSTGIIDSAGRRWKPETYVDMLVRTKAMKVSNEATINEALARGVQFGVISKHGAKDACAKWEGRVVKLTADAPGDYPFIGDLPKREIFHPNCRHTISPIRDPEKVAKPPVVKIKTTDETLEHAVLGDITRNPRTKKVQKMRGGGHGQANIDFLEKNGMEYEITKTYSNGVRAGNVKDHKTKSKRVDSMQTWFPEDWSEADIKEAGEYVANLPNARTEENGKRYAIYKNIDVGVHTKDSTVTTIFANVTQAHLEEG